MTRSIFSGIEIDHLDTMQVRDWVLREAHTDGFKYIVTPNAAHIVKIVDEYEQIAHLYTDADLCVNDSRIIQKISRQQGNPLPLCPGSDLTSALFPELDRLGEKIMIVGSRTEHLEILKSKFPNIEIEHYDPPMGFIKQPAEVDKTLEALKKSEAKIFFFAVGAPQQEILAWRCKHENKDMSGVGLCIGASIDFIVGAQKRAPEIFQKLSLEWLHRLLSNPKRMARRYLIESPRVFLYASKYKTKEALEEAKKAS